MRRGAVTLLSLALPAAVGLAVLVVLVAGREQAPSGEPAAIVPRPAGPFRGSHLPNGVRGAQAPDFSLPDARGGRLGTRSLRGRPYVVTFLYTSCGDVCPLIAQELRQALQALGRQDGEVSVMAVSVDPRGDTPSAVRRWLRRLRLPRNFHYLVGSRGKLKQVWRRYYVAPQAERSSASLHTTSIWLVDRRGRWRTKFSGGVPVRPSDIAHDLRLLIAEHSRG